MEGTYNLWWGLTKTKTTKERGPKEVIKVMAIKGKQKSNLYSIFAINDQQI